MDILYSCNVDGFCIVSSDGDFTRLAIRLRESGMDVIGMGKIKHLVHLELHVQYLQTLSLFMMQKLTMNRIKINLKRVNQILLKYRKLKILLLRLLMKIAIEAG